jgi:hypothetical protein
LVVDLGLSQGEGGPLAASAVASSANGRIAFARYTGEGFNHKYAILTMNPDGTGVTQITSSDEFSWDPTWSPDGTRIAFDDTLDIYVMNEDGTNRVKLTGSAETSLNGGQDWSPDGSKIAFSSTRSGSWDIWVMNADGSNAQRLANDHELESAPAWSPDGSKIAFEADTTPNDRQVYVMLSQGPEIVSVPHVRGLTLRQASILIERSRLILEEVIRSNDPQVASGRIIQIAPPPGTALPHGGKVKLTVSQGVLQVRVPSVIDNTVEEARTILTQAGLEPGEISFRFNRYITEGRVIDQTPLERAVVEKGSRVDLVVSSSTP